jgi:hypothetical protein
LNCFTVVGKGGFLVFRTLFFDFSEKVLCKILKDDTIAAVVSSVRRYENARL